MPAGAHAILDQTRQAVERRARALLAQLPELGGDPVTKAVYEEGTGGGAEDVAEVARSNSI
jgi:hypothetical protein